MSLNTPEKDPFSGTDTTGHEWNGIKELDTPVPWPFRWALWGTIAFAILYWVLYPAIPIAGNFTRGVLGYSSRAAVLDDVASGKAARDLSFADFKNKDIATLAADETLEARFKDSIRPLYMDNCSACHRRDLKGQKNFPNLTDASWLWSGSPEEIEYTLQYGINAEHDDTRYAEMLAFGRDKVLTKPQVNDVVEYVRSLSGLEHDGQAATRGDEIFVENCAACHGDDGAGGLENGAPNLTDDQWVYGKDHADIYATIHRGRRGVMPAWQGRLTDEEIKKLTLYVLWARDD